MKSNLISLGAALGLLLMSVGAVADPGTVAVLRPSYELFREGTQQQKGAEAVFNMVKHAVKEAGMNVADQAETDAALQRLSGSTAAHCDNQSCLKIIAEATGAWNAVAVTVVDKEAHFVLSIKYAVGEELEAKVFGNKASLIEDIFGNVEEVLSDNAPEDPTAATVAEDSSDTPKEDSPVDQPDNTDQAQKEGFKPAVFYASAAVTAALALSWGMVEIVGIAKKNKLEESAMSESWESDRDDLKTLRAVDGVLLGAALAGAITTTVLFFFTDFEQKDEREIRPSITTGFVEDGVTMGIKGTF